MRRALTSIAVLLLLGATVNIAVAWYFACRSDASDFNRIAPSHYLQHQYADRSLLDGMVYEKTGTKYVAISYLSGRYTPMDWDGDVAGFIQGQPRFARRHLTKWIVSTEAPTPPSAYIAVIARGWPMQCLYSIEFIDHTVRGQGPRGEFIDQGAIIIPALDRPNSGYAPMKAIALPYLPIWRGFIVNSLMYAFAVSLPYLTWLVVRRFKRANRIRRGRCPRCAYDLRGNFAAGCTECGWRRDMHVNADR